MRLTKEQVFVICESFKLLFFEGDTLWLFGSRTDDTKRGGDIDLYIETHQTNSSLIYERRSKLSSIIQRKIGEQKIDIVVNTLSQEKKLPIYKEAQETGILLMKKESLLPAQIQNANSQAKRLKEALDYCLTLRPITAEKIDTFAPQEIAFLDMFSTRFSKLQDIIGSRIFPYILKEAWDDSVSFIDKLNKLEKLSFLDDAGWWIDLRELRNTVTHDYPDSNEEIAKHIEELLSKSQGLLDYWKTLKPKLEQFIK